MRALKAIAFGAALCAVVAAVAIGWYTSAMLLHQLGAPEWAIMFAFPLAVLFGLGAFIGWEAQS